MSKKRFIGSFIDFFQNQVDMYLFKGDKERLIIMKEIQKKYDSITIVGDMIEGHIYRNKPLYN